MDLNSQNTPAPSPDLLNRFVDYAQNIFIPALGCFYGGKDKHGNDVDLSHVGTVSIMPDEMMPAHVGAFYITAQPKSQMLETLVGGPVTPITAMYMSMSTAITVAAVLGGRSKLLRPDVRKQILQEFKTELKFVVHEATHSVGPDNLEEFGREVEATQRHGLGPWKEAITELSTQRNLDRIIRAAKLDSADQMLLQVDAADTGSYVGMVEAAEVLVAGLTEMIPGADYDTELRALVAAGCGKTGLANLVIRGLSARGITDTHTVVTVRDSIAQTLTKLDRMYKRTLSQLDNVRPAVARGIMDQLRDQGRAVGEDLLGDIHIASGMSHEAAQRAARGARPISLDDLERLVNRHFSGLGPPRPVGPGDEVRGFGVLVGL